MALGGALLGSGPGCLIFLAAGLGCGLQRKTSAHWKGKGAGQPKGSRVWKGIYILPRVDHMSSPLGQATATKGRAGT